MFILVMNHDVEDYERWKAGFDEYPPTQEGARFYHVNRSIDDPNNITVICGWDKAEAAVAFCEGPALSDAMDRAGVIGARRFEISEEVAASGFARVPWAAVGLEGEQRLNGNGLSVRCLQREDGSLPAPGDESDLVAYVARSY